MLFSVVGWCCGGALVEVEVVALSGGSVVVFWIRNWYQNGWRTGATYGGGWCYLGEEACVCWGDFFWRQPLLHGSMVVVASSCSHFWVV